MGLFRVECWVENHRDRARSVRVPDVIVDTGSEMTWIDQEHLDRIGIEPEKKDMRFVMANGQELVRSIGFAVVRAGGTLTIDEVVFGQPGDLQLLGARTLEGLNLRVDARGKKLVAAGPIIVAGSVPVSRSQDTLAPRTSRSARRAHFRSCTRPASTRRRPGSGRSR